MINRNHSKDIAKHLHQVFFGGNWSDVNVKDTLAGTTWETAINKHEGIHSIAQLTYHIGYFLQPVSDVLDGLPLNASDKVSFDVPSISCQADWDTLISSICKKAERVIEQLQELPEARLNAPFYGDKYGSMLFNLWGIIEHTHYHLGQINLLKKIG